MRSYVTFFVAVFFFHTSTFVTVCIRVGNNKLSTYLKHVSLQNRTYKSNFFFLCGYKIIVAFLRWVDGLWEWIFHLLQNIDDTLYGRLKWENALFSELFHKVILFVAVMVKGKYFSAFSKICGGSVSSCGLLSSICAAYYFRFR